uniref:uncharacterized protein LOC120959802 n=1 Tax=Anopheles coluzzii TaxID=1518534 RepID=UPI0020FFA664|nr:uncharacterized protein LOC120959802 [Anopheles coluzzii]
MCHSVRVRLKYDSFARHRFVGARAAASHQIKARSRSDSIGKGKTLPHKTTLEKSHSKMEHAQANKLQSIIEKKRAVVSCNTPQVISPKKKETIFLSMHEANPLEISIDEEFKMTVLGRDASPAVDEHVQTVSTGPRVKAQQCAFSSRHSSEMGGYIAEPTSNVSCTGLTTEAKLYDNDFQNNIFITDSIVNDANCLGLHNNIHSTSKVPAESTSVPSNIDNAPKVSTTTHPSTDATNDSYVGIGSFNVKNSDCTRVESNTDSYIQATPCYPTDIAVVRQQPTNVLNNCSAYASDTEDNFFSNLSTQAQDNVQNELGSGDDRAFSTISNDIVFSSQSNDDSYYPKSIEYDSSDSISTDAEKSDSNVGQRTIGTEGFQININLDLIATETCLRWINSDKENTRQKLNLMQCGTEILSKRFNLHHSECSKLSLLSSIKQIGNINQDSQDRSSSSDQIRMNPLSDGASSPNISRTSTTPIDQDQYIQSCTQTLEKNKLNIDIISTITCLRWNTINANSTPLQQTQARLARTVLKKRFRLTDSQAFNLTIANFKQLVDNKASASDRNDKLSLGKAMLPQMTKQKSITDGLSVEIGQSAGKRKTNSMKTRILKRRKSVSFVDYTVASSDENDEVLKEVDNESRSARKRISELQQDPDWRPSHRHKILIGAAKDSDSSDETRSDDLSFEHDQHVPNYQGRTTVESSPSSSDNDDLDVANSNNGDSTTFPIRLFEDDALLSQNMDLDAKTNPSKPTVASAMFTKQENFTRDQVDDEETINQTEKSTLATKKVRKPKYDCPEADFDTPSSSSIETDMSICQDVNANANYSNQFPTQEDTESQQPVCSTLSASPALSNTNQNYTKPQLDSLYVASFDDTLDVNATQNATNNIESQHTLDVDSSTHAPALCEDDLGTTSCERKDSGNFNDHCQAQNRDPNQTIRRTFCTVAVDHPYAHIDTLSKMDTQQSQLPALKAVSSTANKNECVKKGAAETTTGNISVVLSESKNKKPNNSHFVNKHMIYTDSVSKPTIESELLTTANLTTTDNSITSAQDNELGVAQAKKRYRIKHTERKQNLETSKLIPTSSPTMPPKINIKPQNKNIPSIPNRPVSSINFLLCENVTSNERMNMPYKRMPRLKYTACKITGAKDPTSSATNDTLASGDSLSDFVIHEKLTKNNPAINSVITTQNADVSMEGNVKTKTPTTQPIDNVSFVVKGIEASIKTNLPPSKENMSKSSVQVDSRCTVAAPKTAEISRSIDSCQLLTLQPITCESNNEPNNSTTNGLTQMSSPPEENLNVNNLHSPSLAEANVKEIPCNNTQPTASENRQRHISVLVTDKSEDFHAGSNLLSDKIANNNPQDADLDKQRNESENNSNPQQPQEENIKSHTNAREIYAKVCTKSPKCISVSGKDIHADSIVCTEKITCNSTQSSKHSLSSLRNTDQEKNPGPRSMKRKANSEQNIIGNGSKVPTALDKNLLTIVACPENILHSSHVGPKLPVTSTTKCTSRCKQTGLASPTLPSISSESNQKILSSDDISIQNPSLSKEVFINSVQTLHETNPIVEEMSKNTNGQNISAHEDSTTSSRNFTSNSFQCSENTLPYKKRRLSLMLHLTPTSSNTSIEQVTRFTTNLASPNNISSKSSSQSGPIQTTESALNIGGAVRNNIITSFRNTQTHPDTIHPDDALPLSHAKFSPLTRRQSLDIYSHSQFIPEIQSRQRQCSHFLPQVLSNISNNNNHYETTAESSSFDRALKLHQNPTIFLDLLTVQNTPDQLQLDINEFQNAQRATSTPLTNLSRTTYSTQSSDQSNTDHSTSSRQPQHSNTNTSSKANVERIKAKRRRDRKRNQRNIDTYGSNTHQTTERSKKRSDYDNFHVRDDRMRETPNSILTRRKSVATYTPTQFAQQSTIRQRRNSVYNSNVLSNISNNKNHYKTTTASSSSDRAPKSHQNPKLCLEPLTVQNTPDQQQSAKDSQRATSTPRTNSSRTSYSTHSSDQSITDSSHDSCQPQRSNTPSVNLERSRARHRHDRERNQRNTDTYDQNRTERSKKRSDFDHFRVRDDRIKETPNSILTRRKSVATYYPTQLELYNISINNYDDRTTVTSSTSDRAPKSHQNPKLCLEPLSVQNTPNQQQRAKDSQRATSTPRTNSSRTSSYSTHSSDQSITESSHDSYQPQRSNTSSVNLESSRTRHRHDREHNQRNTDTYSQNRTERSNDDNFRVRDDRIKETPNSILTRRKSIATYTPTQLALFNISINNHHYRTTATSSTSDRVPKSHFPNSRQRRRSNTSSVNMRRSRKMRGKRGGRKANRKR